MDYQEALNHTMGQMVRAAHRAIGAALVAYHDAYGKWPKFVWTKFVGDITKDDKLVCSATAGAFLPADIVPSAEMFVYTVPDDVPDNAMLEHVMGAIASYRSPHDA